MKKIALFSLIAAVAGVSAADAGWRDMLSSAPSNGAWRQRLADAPSNGAWRDVLAESSDVEAKPVAVAPKAEENVGGFVPASEPVVEEIEVTEE